MLAVLRSMIEPPRKDDIKRWVVCAGLCIILLWSVVASGQEAPTVATGQAVPPIIEQWGGDIVAYVLNQYGIPGALFLLAWRAFGVMPKLKEIRVPLAPVEVTVSQSTIDKIAAAFFPNRVRRRRDDEDDHNPLSDESLSATPTDRDRTARRKGP